MSRSKHIRRITPNICDACGALLSDNALTYCHKKWLCTNCFQKEQKFNIHKQPRIVYIDELNYF